MKKINFSTTFCKVKFKTPLIAPSGIVVEPDKIISLCKTKALGGATTKSYSLLPRQGHPMPHIASFQSGFINAVGLKNPGINKAIGEVKKIKKKTKKPIIASIFAGQLSEFAHLAQQIKKAKPDLIELNLSCPHVDDEFGRPLACDPLLSAMAVLEVKNKVKDIPILAKLTPNTPDLKQVAYEVEKAGADALCAINTVGPGLLINIKQKKPILGHGVGGTSGPAIKPIALRCVNDIYKTVKIPIIGMGGVSNGKDALEMIMAGATLVGIGSAIYQQGFKVFNRVLEEMQGIINQEKLGSLKKIRGII